MSKLLSTHEGITITLKRDEGRIDSRIVADVLGIQHESFLKSLEQYQGDLSQFGIFRFEIGKIKGRGRPEKFAPHIPLDTTPRPAHNARVAATSATGFSRLNTRRASRRMTVFLCPKSAYASRNGVVAGEALGLAGFLCRSANPCRHAAIWNSSQSAAFTTQEVPS